MSSRQNIFLIGPMGAGKTSIGQQLARELGFEFFDSDKVIEERTGADIPWIIELEGEEGFKEREAKVIAELVQRSRIVLATGGGTVSEQKNRAALIANGIVIYLLASLEHQVKRTERSKKRPLAREEEKRRNILQKLQDKLEPIYESLADFTYNTENRSVKSVARQIVKDLNQKAVEKWAI